MYDTLRRLHRDRPLDALEFADAGGEALTVLRAKRLLVESLERLAVVRRELPA